MNVIILKWTYGDVDKSVYDTLCTETAFMKNKFVPIYILDYFRRTCGVV